MILTYPISQGSTVNALAVVFQHSRAGTALNGPSVVDVDNEELAKYFVGWEPAAQTVTRLSKPLHNLQSI